LFRFFFFFNPRKSGKKAEKSLDASPFFSIPIIVIPKVSSDFADYFREVDSDIRSNQSQQRW